MTDSLPLYQQIRDPDEKRALADRGMDFALVASRFNEPVVNRLVEGATATLVARGANVKNIDLIRVPGAFELPAAARLCADTGMYDAIIALGCVIRGETPHFDYVASECARNLARLARREDVPILFGVLTTDTREQAEQRSVLFDDWQDPAPRVEGDRKVSNKGAEAAVAALEMIEVFAEIMEDIDDDDDDDDD